MDAMDMDGKTEGNAHKLGMFSGVFTPSILTILGIILFLRMGYTVGSAGLGKSLILITLASLVSVLTTISLSAIATNIQIRGGGAYYLISRTLGVRFGGAIGLVLFLAQSVSIAFYCIGFGEALSHLLALDHPSAAHAVSVGAVIFLFFLAWVGADLATKFQYIVMVLLVLALGSFFVGGISLWQPETLGANFKAPDTGPSFWVLFAIFFPAVTGFTQGVNMSGDLKDPGHAIPLGTFLAVGLSTLIYFLVAIVFSGAMTNDELATGYDAMKRAAWVPGLIDAGVISATLSSAMASFLGAPRILQSIARDRIFKILVPFAKGEGGSENPRRGVMLSALIALVTISLGQLNLIAQVVSMFFLISYALINYATYYESRTAAPSFRPGFKWFRPWVGLTGFALCSGAILAIDMRSGLMALGLLFAIYQFLKHHGRPARWADSRRAYFLQQAGKQLKAAAEEPEHERDWRPVILALSHNDKRLKGLVDFSSQLEGGAGLTAVVRLIPGQGARVRALRDKLRSEFFRQVREKNSKAFPMLISVPDIAQALPILFQSFGIGPIKANTLLINYMDELSKGLEGLGPIQYARNLRTVFREGKNIVVLHTDDHRQERVSTTRPEARLIDVWWFDDANSRLMLMLAYLMTRSPFWEKAGIRVMVPQSRAGERQFEQMISLIRIHVEIIIVPEDTAEIIIKTSGKSSCVFLPFRIRENQIMDVKEGSFARLLPHLPVTALVMAAQGIDLDADPETGLQGEVARAEDEMNQAQNRLKKALKEEAASKAEADDLTAQLLAFTSESDAFSKLIRMADQAIQRAEDDFKRAAKARVKAEEAENAYKRLVTGETGEEASG